MREHWEEALILFEILAYILKRLDPDGLELYFTCTEGKHKKRNTTDLIEIARSRAPPADVMRPSNIFVRLNSILEQYQEKLRNPQSRFGIPRSSRDMRKLNLYVLTDGLWQPESDAETPIKHLVKTLDELDKPLNQVGIQFIRFGDDPHGRARLEHLDSGLKGFSKCSRHMFHESLLRQFADTTFSRDIVDTEPSNGNIWKMLLGSINKWLDSDANTTSNGTDFPGVSLQGLYEGLKNRLEHIAEGPNTITTNEVVAEFLDDVILRLEMWGYDIKLDEGTLKLIEEQSEHLGSVAEVIRLHLTKFAEHIDQLWLAAKEQDISSDKAIVEYVTTFSYSLQRNWYVLCALVSYRISKGNKQRYSTSQTCSLCHHRRLEKCTSGALDGFEMTMIDCCWLSSHCRFPAGSFNYLPSPL